MATDVIMPALGVAQETGTLLRWLRSEGELVEKGVPIMEIETDKATVEVEAPATGTLAGVRVPEGADVPVGGVVAVILAEGEEPPPEMPASVEEPTAAAVEEVAAVGASAEEEPAAQQLGRPEGPARRVLASPKARRIAAERGLDLGMLAGSGPHGAVVASDVEHAGAGDGAAPTPAAEPAPVAAPIAVGAIWRRMAERTAESWRSAPHFYLSREVEAARLESWREAAGRRPGAERVTHTDLLVRIAAAALREHPQVNASWRDETIVENPDVNVGIAVAIDDGLVVPVVQGADRLELGQIAARRTELVEAAREGRLKPEDMAGGTFTISNLGMFGVDSFAAIVNPPQAAILAVGRIVERVVPVDGGPAVRPMCTLTVSFDHRVVDGARGARFLETLAELVEEPAGLVP